MFFFCRPTEFVYLFLLSNSYMDNLVIICTQTHQERFQRNCYNFYSRPQIIWTVPRNNLLQILIWKSVKLCNLIEQIPGGETEINESNCQYNEPTVNDTEQPVLLLIDIGSVSKLALNEQLLKLIYNNTKSTDKHHNTVYILMECTHYYCLLLVNLNIYSLFPEKIPSFENNTRQTDSENDKMFVSNNQRRQSKGVHRRRTQNS